MDMIGRIRCSDNRSHLSPQIEPPNGPAAAQSSANSGWATCRTAQGSGHRVSQQEGHRQKHAVEEHDGFPGQRAGSLVAAPSVPIQRRMLGRQGFEKL